MQIALLECRAGQRKRSHYKVGQHEQGLSQLLCAVPKWETATGTGGDGHCW